MLLAGGDDNLLRLLCVRLDMDIELSAKRPPYDSPSPCLRRWPDCVHVPVSDKDVEERSIVRYCTTNVWYNGHVAKSFNIILWYQVCAFCLPWDI